VPFTARDLKMPEVKFHSLQNTLWLLSKAGYLDKPRGKGTLGKYILRGRRAPQNGAKPVPARVVRAARATPVQAIYDLLDFMAKAEAPLKRAAKILEAVDNA
jgi:hypothetical protein